MNTFDTLDNRCRVCALELSDLTCSIAIFEESSNNFFLQSKISKYLYITVLEDDLLPKKICATCFLKIESIDKFAYSAAKNQECFTSWLENNRQAKVDISQTLIETSTNSDFSFNNITIKKEFNHRQQIVIQPHKTRNPRHVDHITLEQIINDQIIKNPKLPASTTITKIDEPKRQRKQSQKNETANNISIVSYHNLQIGQLIKDYELLKLILRALKWEEYDRKASYQELIERLRRSNCRDILTNKNLLSDNDVVQLLRPYVNDSMLMNLIVANVQQTTVPHQKISKLFQQQPVLLVASSIQSQSKLIDSAIKQPKPSTITMQHEEAVPTSESMEVSVDPGMFLADEESIMIEDDEETVSATESKIETVKLNQFKEQSDNEAMTKKPLEKKVTFKEDVQADSNEIINTQNYVCSSCPECFTSHTDLQNHVVTHLITSTSSATSTKINDSAIETPTKKRKAKEERMRSRRRKIMIRINPSPSKRNVREKAKILPKYVCAICKKSLSSKRNLHLHHETHRQPKNGRFKCDGDGCRKLFGKLENFVKHRQEAHEKPTKRKKNLNEK